MQVDNYIPITQAKTKFLDMIRDMEGDTTIAITKNGIPKAIIISMEQYEAIHETMSILADESTIKQIRQSLNEIHCNQPLIDLEDIN